MTEEFGTYGGGGGGNRTHAQGLKAEHRRGSIGNTLRYCVGTAALLLSACNPEVGKVVGVVSDSTLFLSLEQLHFEAARKDNGDLIIPLASIPCSALGRDLAYFTGRAESAQARGVPLDAVVVSLGTNDIGMGDETNPIYAWPYIDTPEELQAALDALLAALPDVPVVWVVPSSPESPAERKAYFREQLEAAQARWPKLHLLTPDASWFVGQAEDGIHYSLEGEDAAARAIVSAVDAL